MNRGLRITNVIYDEVRNFSPAALRAIAPTIAPLAADRLGGLLYRRERLITDVALGYGVTLYPHPRRPHVVVVAASDMGRLHTAVMLDRHLSAVGRGYYLGLGGELDIVPAPDWTCDPRRVAAARLVAATLVRPARRVLRLFGRTRAAHR